MCVVIVGMFILQSLFPKLYLIVDESWTIATDCIQLGCPSKLVSIRNNRNWNETSFSTIRNKTFVSVVSLTETEQTEDQQKQFDRDPILLF
jgi:hypothetical protein